MTKKPESHLIPCGNCGRTWMVQVSVKTIDNCTCCVNLDNIEGIAVHLKKKVKKKK